METIGHSFNPNLFEKARLEAWELINKVASKVEIGMSEGDLLKVLEYDSQHVERWWHPTKIRFHQNTICSFRDTSTPNIKLEKDNLFFLDIGPVFYDHEADVGQTFKLGDPSFKNPAQELFSELKQYWMNEGLSGKALYELACEIAERKNLIFNLKMAGHRLSEFPHALHHKGPLKDWSETISSKRWVLEVHLLEKDQSLGYFFEDLLI
ncbi:MAG: aminopeptidase P family protein [Bacteriovoracaceae bacterium]|nr:aminopeptidase P family protein [Bacteriovoracaceae bacterium]